jgi:nucleoside-diphosphate-sugar epimerase
MLKIAITGANGFVGSNLVRFLSANDFEVTPLVRVGADLSLLPTDVKPLEVDYNDGASFAEAIAECDVLIHNAAITRGKNWDEYHQQNVALTEQVITAVNRTQRVKQLVFISSQAASGLCSGIKGKTEEDRCSPLTYYGKSKLHAENLVKQISKKPWTIIRPTSVYGPGDRDFLHYFKFVKSGVAPLVGFKPKYVCMIYIEELCYFIGKTLDNKDAFNETFFASDGLVYSWDDFIDKLEIAIGKKAKRIRIPESLLGFVALSNEVMGKLQDKTPLITFQKLKEIKGSFWTCNPAKSQKILGIEPFDRFEENIRETYEWYQDQKWL